MVAVQVSNFRTHVDIPQMEHVALNLQRDVEPSVAARDALHPRRQLVPGVRDEVKTATAMCVCVWMTTSRTANLSVQIFPQKSETLDGP